MATDVQMVIPTVVDRAQIMRIFQAGYDDATRHQMEAAWLEQRDKWLRRYESPKTRRAYEDAWRLWFEFLGRPLWMATSEDVTAWQDAMTDAGRSNATVNTRLAAVSSFYTFVIRQVKLGADGIERSLFFDATGRTRANPFKTGNVDRLPKKTVRYNEPLSKEQLKAMRDCCNTLTKTGARDLALFECLLRSGRRSTEIVSLRWGEIRPNREMAGQFVFDWRGKGSKSGKRVFPAQGMDAIVVYLKVDGRWPVTDDEMFIFQPLTDHGTPNLEHVKTVPPQNRHISIGQVNNVIKKLGRAAGIPAEKVHTHSLRHCFAYFLNKATHDLELVQKALDHSSLVTTMGYIARMEEPKDQTSAALQQALGF